jgi:phosphoadenosine phosphosulfate reductase
MSYHAADELDRYPKFKATYIRAFEKMIAERNKRGLPTEWKTGEEVMDWWLGRSTKEKQIEGQMSIDDYTEE